MALDGTHYDVLGVARGASSVDIASAFRDQLAQLKRDGVDPEAIEALREAYQTLANPSRRADYDETLAPLPGRPASRPAAVDDEALSTPGIWNSRAIKYLVPVVVVAIAVWGWKSRHKPPEAAIPSSKVSEAPAESSANVAAPSAASASERSPALAQPAPSSGSRSAEQVFADAAGSVVRVQVSDVSGRPMQQGSGVVVGAGKVVTNCHVARGGAQVVVKIGASTLPASVSVADEEHDLCSLDVAGLDATAATIASVSSVRIGQRVYAIGAPMGLELTISEGIVSSLREVSDGKVIQTTAPVSSGSSGGGLFNADGQLVGIVTFQHRFGQNLNFALPADWISEMRTRGAGRAAAASGQPPTVPEQPATAPLSMAEMIVGKWGCRGSLAGRNGEYAYGSDGLLRVVSGDGRNIQAQYHVAGRRIQYQADNAGVVLDIESIAGDRMVQVVEGERLECERRP